MLNRKSFRFLGRRSISDAAQTTVAFALVVGVQQLALLPFLASRVSPSEFAYVILVITLSAVISNLVGGESANALLIRGGRYARSGIRWDFHIVFLVASALGIPVSVLAWRLLGFDLAVTATAALLTGLTSARLFLAAPFRLDQRFGFVTIAHSAYLIGGLAGLPLISLTDIAIVPFLTGEIASVITLYAFLRRSSHGVRIGRDGQRGPFRNSFTFYLTLASAGLLANAVAYLDRLIIAPMLGVGALAVYFAASVIPKTVIVILNPVMGLLLARFGSMDDGDAAAVFRILQRLIPAVGIAGGAIAFVAGLMGLALLYPQYEMEGTRILAPIALAVGLTAAAQMLQPFVLRFRPPRSIVGANMIQALVFFTTAISLSSLFGVVGFAWASAAAGLANLTALFVLSRGGRSAAVSSIGHGSD